MSTSLTEQVPRRMLNNPTTHGFTHQIQRDMVTDDRYQDLRRPRKLRFYVNGDRYFRGKKMHVTPNRYYNFNDLLNDLTGKLPSNMNLPYGVRQIFTPAGGRRIFNIEDLADGETYVCAGFEGFKTIKYGRADLEPWSTARPQQPVNGVDAEGDHPGNSYRYLGYANNAFHPGRYIRTNASYQQRRWPGTFGNQRRVYAASTGQSDKSPLKPKVITVVRNGQKPRHSVKMLLNRRSVQTYEQLVSDISEAFGPKFKNSKVRRLFSVNGKEVHGISDFFRDDDCFIAIGVGEPHILDADAADILEELFPEGEYAKSLLKDWERHQRRRRKISPTGQSVRASKDGSLVADSANVPDKRDSGFDSIDESTNRSELDRGGRGGRHRRQQEKGREDGVERVGRDEGEYRENVQATESSPPPHGYYLMKKLEKQRLKVAAEERERAKRRQQKMVEVEKRVIDEDKRKQGLVPLKNIDNPFKRGEDARDKEMGDAKGRKGDERKKEEEKKKDIAAEEEDRLNVERKEKEKEERAAAERAARERMARVQRDENERQEREIAENKSVNERQEKESVENERREKEKVEKKKQEKERPGKDILGKEKEKAEKRRADKDERGNKKSEKASSKQPKNVDISNEASAAPAKQLHNETDHHTADVKQREEQDKTNQAEPDDVKVAESNEPAPDPTAASDVTDVPVATQDVRDTNNNNKQQQKEKRNREEKQQQGKRTKTKIVRRTKEERQVSSDEFILDLYKLGRKLGDGNFAVVKQSRKKETGQEYAIKVIDKAKLKGKEHMVENEIALMKDCSHNNIVRLYEEYETAEQIYLVMELVKGGDLFDAITQSVKFGEVESSLMVKDLCNALYYMHSRSIVHRDLKPENLLVHRNKDGTITLKLADFGLAMEVKELIYTVCGTPTYVAPEILTEIGYGLEVDMWAMGVITYILLCGFPPFRSPDRNQTELFEFIKAGEYEFLSPYWDNTSSSAKDLISRLLIVDRRKRYTAVDVLSHKWTVCSGQIEVAPQGALSVDAACKETHKELEAQAKLNYESYQRLKEKRKRERDKAE